MEAAAAQPRSRQAHRATLPFPPVSAYVPFRARRRSPTNSAAAPRSSSARICPPTPERSHRRAYINGIKRLPRA